MADGMLQVSISAPIDVLARIVDEFSFLPDVALDGIIHGAPAGYISPSLASAIIEGRRAVQQCYNLG